MQLGSPRRIAVALASLTVAAALAGCGRPASAGGSGSSPTPDPKTAAYRFAACMRAHGVDMPDPQTISNGAGGGTVHEFKANPGSGNNPLPDPKSQQFQAAQRACRSLLPNGGQLSPQQQAQQRENALKFAQCMRAHGVDLPDPGNGGSGSDRGLSINGVGIGAGNINPDDPAFKSAMNACQSVLGNVGGNGGFAIQGGGPSTGGGSGPVTNIGG
jgi:hypothetical protein